MKKPQDVDILIENEQIEPNNLIELKKILAKYKNILAKKLMQRLQNMQIQ